MGTKKKPPELWSAEGNISSVAPVRYRFPSFIAHSLYKSTKLYVVLTVRVVPEFKLPKINFALSTPDNEVPPNPIWKR